MGFSKADQATLCGFLVRKILLHMSAVPRSVPRMIDSKLITHNL